MKTLLLTSSGSFITENKLDFLPKPLNQMKMAYITTASKGAHYLSYIERHKKRMTELGFNFEELDLDGKNPDKLAHILENKEAVFVEGGNTFYLLKSIRESGFEKIIRDFIERGGIYIGSSAGSYVCCPSIEMATWKNPTKYDRFGIIDFTGMNFVPFLMSVHYIPDYKDLLKEKISQSKYPVKILTDKQAILVQGDGYQLIGVEKEVIL